MLVQPQVLTAVALGKMTDTYGALPWTEALQGHLITNPKYDTQAEIYREIQQLLDDGIANFNTSIDSDFNTYDPIYSGNLQKWKAAAFGLKARYANHLSKLFPTQSSQDALQAIDNAKSEGLDFGWNMEFQHDGATTINAWSEVANSGELVGAKIFIEDLKQSEDPRLYTFFSPNILGAFNGKGIHCFESEDTAAFSLINRDGLVGSMDAPTSFISYFEILFIESEAAFRAGNLERAAYAYNKGIVAAMRKLVDQNDNQLQLLAERYCNNFANETANSITLGKIMHQKYKSMFGRGIENWVDLRRHNFRFPFYLSIPLDQMNFPLANDFIRRGLYPSSQIEHNAENIPEATIFDRLWWDN